MTLLETEDLLPNGFHDAHILGIAIDYLKRTIVMTMDVCVSAPGEPDKYRKGNLYINRFIFFVQEAPDAKYLNEAKGGLWISDVGEIQNIKKSPELLLSVPQEAFANYFYINNYNSHIVVAAYDSSWEWNG